MTGSLQKKNGKYHVVTYIDKKPKWISTGIPVAGNNIRKAQQRMREILTELEQKKITLNRDILLADYIKLWLEAKQSEIELNTWESYELYVNTVIDPYFRPRKTKLQDTSSQDIKLFFLSLQQGTDNKKPRSVESIKKYRVCINGAFKMAMESNLVAYNPVDRVKLKKSPEEEAFKGDFYTVDEAKHLLELLQGDVLLPVVQLTLFYGLRRSEVLGLRWSAVDFLNNTIRIERTVVQTKTIIDKKRTKNKSSLRTMPLIPSIKAMLLRQKQDQADKQRLSGSSYIQSDYICRLTDGTPMKPNYITHHFAYILKKMQTRLRRFAFTIYGTRPQVSCCQKAMVYKISKHG